MPLPSLVDFMEIGEYRRGAFALDREAEKNRGLYIWAHRANGSLIPRRVGIACSRGGFGARYRLYNRWLAGTFKPDDPREQEVRRLTLEGLGGSAEVWGYRVEDRSEALDIESRLRRLWSESLTLDLMVRDSWIKLEMDAWRKGQRGDGKADQTPAESCSNGRRDRRGTGDRSRAEEVDFVARAFLSYVADNGRDEGWIQGSEAFRFAIDQCRELDWVRYAESRPKAWIAITAAIERLMREEFPEVEKEKRGEWQAAPVFYRVRSG